MSKSVEIRGNSSYPPEPDTYDRGMIERHYANFDKGSLHHLIAWQKLWQTRLGESGYWGARPRLCQMHLETVTAEIDSRNKQLPLF